MAVNTAAENQPTTFAGNIGPATITTNGVATNFPIEVNKSGGTFVLTTPLVTPRALSVTAGNLLANSLAVTAASFSATGTQPRNVDFGNITVTLTGTGWDFADSTNATLVSTNSNIVLSATTANARTFNSGTGLTYANLIIGGTTGSSTLTMSGNSTWVGTISSTKTVAHSILFVPGSVTTVAGWTVTGTANAALTLGSTIPGGVNRLVYTGAGNVNVDYASISYSNVRPLNTWFAGNSAVNDGNNNGWTFANQPASSNGFFMII
jgi:hypothetical protein